MSVVRSALMMAFLAGALAQADTVLLADNSEVNGVVMFDGTNFIVTARTKRGTITRRYGRKEVETIEFNDLDYNGEEPPSSITVLKRDASDMGTQQTKDEGHVVRNHKSDQRSQKSSSDQRYNQSAGPDSVKLRNERRKVSGRLVRIGSDQVEIAAGRKHLSYPRRDVAGLIVGRGQ